VLIEILHVGLVVTGSPVAIPYTLLDIEEEARVGALGARELNLVSRLPYNPEALVKPTL
jgi:hypothetical protein